jgi:hypothetical protein
MLNGRLFFAGLVLSILSCGHVFGQATKSAPTVEPDAGSDSAGPSGQSGWTVQFAGDRGASFKRTECHPIRYFQTNLKQLDSQAIRPADDHSSVRRDGTINGFAIYDVIHQFKDGSPSDAPLSFNLKIILVGHKPGEFCEIYQDRGDTGEITIEPSYIEHIGSESVLVSRDPVSGTGGIVSQSYWTFDQAGPIPIEFFELIVASLHKLIPGATDANTSMGFTIHDMTYDNAVWKEGDGLGPSGGHITIRFRFKAHRPVVASANVRPN